MAGARLLAIAFVLLSTTQAFAHGDASWIMNNPATSYCCGPNDCGPVRRDEVKVTREGYVYANQVIPFAEAMPSIDDQFWVCRLPDGVVRCFFAPKMET